MGRDLRGPSGDHVSSDREAEKVQGTSQMGKSDESSERAREEENDEAHFHLTHFRWWPDLVWNANYGHVGDLDTFSDTGR